eukprot:5637517-Ditylum_brightwellii.AAC.1
MLCFNSKIASTAVLLESLEIIREQHFNNEWKDCKLGTTKLYVDKFKYPPPVAGLKQLPNTDHTWKKLSHDVQYASHESGSPLILNYSNGVCCHM